ncbi:TPA: phage recombination protein Bet [Escherichia coli]|nr:phage recombination protein Bet [Escherichia coli]HDH7172511.1 phage recombination protein Bet [Escherichia coli]
MSTALATLAGKLAERVGMDSVDPQELITTLRQTAFKGDASDAQFIALLIVANQYGLNPWTKEIYAFPDKQNGIVPVVGVDGWSRIINENQQFDGMDFEQDNESCTCRIYRKDRNHPICVTEWMDECRREPFKTREGREITGPWQSHPKRMLRHKAMIQCARLAFGFAGIYDKDEAERIVENTAYTAERQPERDITPVKEPGNYPVTPDGWISCSERMPEMGERQCYVLAADFKNNYPPNIPNTQVGVYGDWFNDGNPTWDDGDGEDLYLKEVTHWMPLPEPPRLKEL